MSFTRLPIFKFAFISATLGFSSNVTANETTLPYGSRAGMEVMITKKSGIGTKSAKILIEHTKRNARHFCVEYELDYSDECIQSTHAAVNVNEFVSGNCQTGQFVNVWGERFIFKGRSNTGMPEYDIIDLTEDQLLDGSSASGYDVQLPIIQELCPNLFPELIKPLQKEARP